MPTSSGRGDARSLPGPGDPGGGAVLLLGAPGVGKSTLGRLLASRAPPGSRFLSVGEELRAQGLVRRQEEAPSAARRAQMREAAAELLRGACREWLEASRTPAASGATTSPSAPLLLLECVKDTEDAFAAVEVLEAEGVPLLQVGPLHPPQHLHHTRPEGGDFSRHVGDWPSHVLRRPGPGPARVAERQAKWAAHAGRVLELFSALGVLSELTEWTGAETNRSTDTANLGSMGYAAGPTVWEPLPLHDAHVPSPEGEPRWRPRDDSTQTHKVFGSAAVPDRRSCSPTAADHEPDPPPPPPAWLAASGLRLPAGLACTPLQPVTSARLVTSRAERDRVLAKAAEVSGLRLDGFFRGGASGGPALPVPTSSVDSSGAARWVGVPGRYAVSRKADGTRYLLMVVAERADDDLGGGGSGGGSCGSSSAYLLDRVGSLYKFPIRSSGPAAHAGGAYESLPAGTLLDGELVWVGGRGFFLAFDALCVGGRRLWSRPLRERLAALEGGGSGTGVEGLRLEEAETSKELKAASASKPPEPTPSAQKEPALRKKQQAPPATPSGDAIRVLRKRQLAVTAEALRGMRARPGACPYPSDGLVFTPYGMPYVLGMAELLFKWQPPEQVGVDLRGTELPHAHVLPPLVYECLPATDGGGGHVPVDIRWDKASGNSPAAVGQMTSQHREHITLEQLAAEAEEATRAAPMQPEQQQRVARLAPHPARAMPYDKLYGSVMAAVEAGSVERTVDIGSGLEIFNYRRGAPLDPVEALCRGLVLHPPSRARAATPFTKFAEVRSPAVTFSRPTEAECCIVCGCPAEVDEEGERICSCESCAGRGCVRRPPGGWWRRWLPHRSATSSLLPEADEVQGPALGPGAETEVRSAWAISPQDLLAVTAIGSGARACGSRRGRRGALAAAAVKVDGSMIVAFTWGGQLRTATRRRLDSEQAVWANDWLQRNANPSAFQPGWTYVLEAVYGNNTHVVPYAFEGLVLLAATDPEGRELPRRELPTLADALGVPMAVPSKEGELEELLCGLPGARPLASASMPPVAAADPDSQPELDVPQRPSLWEFTPLRQRSVGPAAVPPTIPLVPPAFEGWVLAAPDVRRYKLVQESYKRASWAGRLLHPLSVWDRVCCGGASHASLSAGLPGHFRSELDSILAALSECYGEARAELLRVLRAAARAGRLKKLMKRLPAASDGGGGDQALAALLSQLNLDDEPAEPTAGPAANPAVDTATSSAAASPRPGVGPGSAAGFMACPHFRRALAHAAEHLYRSLPGAPIPDTCAPASMFLAPPCMDAPHDTPPPAGRHLHALLLHAVRPGADGSLPGYTPSPGFAQTWAKGWAQGPVGRMDPAQAPPVAGLPDEVLERCLAPLEGKDLAAALCASARWRRVLAEALPAGSLRRRLKAARRAAARERTAANQAAAVRSSAGRGWSRFWDDDDEPSFGRHAPDVRPIGGYGGYWNRGDSDYGGYGSY
ncbi:hypothetical protein HYH03_012945 [Edaphochlamys debaryana]|uniref:mRNA capping enzyme adenylation domain-containing protein n=1 Tax=Edaphochlamys debaryana TaxID=47281 RepID=A0A835XSZ7_9CHLO|nr:hypothetical protein HYH03_012945 [Edaphochlamys debaryana]|eukprot:KAG2488438.1 hypothetical protein HYH03_012945 [Edaphochlamys debaryana]